MPGEQLLLRGEADGALGLFNPPGQRQSALTPTHAQHQDLVAIGGLGLVEDQGNRCITPGLNPSTHHNRKLMDGEPEALNACITAITQTVKHSNLGEKSFGI